MESKRIPTEASQIGHPSIRKESLKMLSGIPTYFPDILDTVGVTQVDSAMFEKKLESHLCHYLPYLGRKEHVKHLFGYIRGLLSDLSRKSMEPIALAFEGGPKEARNLMNFMSKALMDDHGMPREYQKEVGTLLAHPKAMLTGDGSDFPKQGKHSVGVAPNIAAIWEKSPTARPGSSWG
jgi:hypothetical protein